MSIFTQHDEHTAPSAASDTLAQVKARYGFIPTIAAYVAESPVALKSLLQFATAFDDVSLNEQEQQIVMLTVSAKNECSFCATFHRGMSRRAGIDDGTVSCAVSGDELKDPKLNALAVFTRAVVDKNGWANDADIAQFLAAGFTKAQVFEVIMGVSLKVLTNYCNHVTGAEPNDEIIEMAGGVTALSA